MNFNRVYLYKVHLYLKNFFLTIEAVSRKLAVWISLIRGVESHRYHYIILGQIVMKIIKTITSMEQE